MPSFKDPISTVQPGPGIAPDGSVSATSLNFNPSGGAAMLTAQIEAGKAALSDHLNDGSNAHGASAIGAGPYNSTAVWGVNYGSVNDAFVEAFNGLNARGVVVLDANASALDADYVGANALINAITAAAASKAVLYLRPGLYNWTDDTTNATVLSAVTLIGGGSPVSGVSPQVEIRNITGTGAIRIGNGSSLQNVILTATGSNGTVSLISGGCTLENVHFKLSQKELRVQSQYNVLRQCATHPSSAIGTYLRDTAGFNLYENLRIEQLEISAAGTTRGNCALTNVRVGSSAFSTPTPADPVVGILADNNVFNGLTITAKTGTTLTNNLLYVYGSANVLSRVRVENAVTTISAVQFSAGTSNVVDSLTLLNVTACSSMSYNGLVRVGGADNKISSLRIQTCQITGTTGYTKTNIALLFTGDTNTVENVTMLNVQDALSMVQFIGYGHKIIGAYLQGSVSPMQSMVDFSYSANECTFQNARIGGFTSTLVAALDSGAIFQVYGSNNLILNVDVQAIAELAVPVVNFIAADGCRAEGIKLNSCAAKTGPGFSVVKYVLATNCVARNFDLYFQSNAATTSGLAVFSGSIGCVLDGLGLKAVGTGAAINSPIVTAQYFHSPMPGFSTVNRRCTIRNVTSVGSKYTANTLLFDINPLFWEGLTLEDVQCEDAPASGGGIVRVGVTTVKFATTSNYVLSGLTSAVMDGNTPFAGDRILVRAQTNAAENGIWIASSSAWTRATDADTWSELRSLAVVVEAGTFYAGRTLVANIGETGTLGTTAIPWVELVPYAVAPFTTVKAATIANHSLTGVTAIDGYSPSPGDRILVRSQTNLPENGIYAVTSSGSWQRTSDANTWSAIRGVTIFVEQGTTQGRKKYMASAIEAGTLGTSSIAYVESVVVPVPTRISNSQFTITDATVPDVVRVNRCRTRVVFDGCVFSGPVPIVANVLGSSYGVEFHRSVFQATGASTKCAVSTAAGARYVQCTFQGANSGTIASNSGVQLFCGSGIAGTGDLPTAPLVIEDCRMEVGLRNIASTGMSRPIVFFGGANSTREEFGHGPTVVKGLRIVKAPSVSTSVMTNWHNHSTLAIDIANQADYVESSFDDITIDLAGIPFNGTGESATSLPAMDPWFSQLGTLVEIYGPTTGKSSTLIRGLKLVRLPRQGNATSAGVAQRCVILACGVIFENLLVDAASGTLPNGTRWGGATALLMNCIVDGAEFFPTTSLPMASADGGLGVILWLTSSQARNVRIRKISVTEEISSCVLLSGGSMISDSKITVTWGIRFVGGFGGGSFFFSDASTVSNNIVEVEHYATSIDDGLRLVAYGTNGAKILNNRFENKAVPKTKDYNSGNPNTGNGGGLKIVVDGSNNVVHGNDLIFNWNNGLAATAYNIVVDGSTGGVERNTVSYNRLVNAALDNITGSVGGSVAIGVLAGARNTVIAGNQLRCTYGAYGSDGAARINTTAGAQSNIYGNTIEQAGAGGEPGGSPNSAGLLQTNTGDGPKGSALTPAQGQYMTSTTPAHLNVIN